MNEQELNKKLADWAGIPLRAIDFGLPYSLDVYDPPNFTQSLDACFKWLVPKLVHLNLLIDVTHKPTAEVWGDRCEMARGETPTLALCLAIEKLIDLEAKE